MTNQMTPSTTANACVKVQRHFPAPFENDGTQRLPNHCKRFGRQSRYCTNGSGTTILPSSDATTPPESSLLVHAERTSIDAEPSKTPNNHIHFLSRTRRLLPHYSGHLERVKDRVVISIGSSSSADYAKKTSGSSGTACALLR